MKTKFDNILVTRRPSFAILYDFLKVALYQRMTHSALPLFVRGRDVISSGPMAVGSHEPHVAAILEIFATKGFSDFLFDIGANIGLTSSVVGNLFEQVVLFEPNPLCCGILETNLAISLVNTPYEIRRYGLGTSDGKLTLKVPRSNWGGAYVVSDDNAYSNETLLAKDGFISEDSKNYMSMNIDIRCGVDVLKRLFEELKVANKLHGSIKIDVEGFEMVVLQAIAAALPSEMGLSIVFEYWTDEFPGKEILSSFNGRAHLYGMIKTPRVSGSRWRKLLALLSAGGQTYSLIPWEQGIYATDFVLRIDPIA
jgi:FkbM family methyltransferase